MGGRDSSLVIVFLHVIVTLVAVIVFCLFGDSSFGDSNFRCGDSVLSLVIVTTFLVIVFGVIVGGGRDSCRPTRPLARFARSRGREAMGWPVALVGGAVLSHPVARFHPVARSHPVARQ